MELAPWEDTSCIYAWEDKTKILPWEDIADILSWEVKADILSSEDKAVPKNTHAAQEMPSKMKIFSVFP